MKQSRLFGKTIKQAPRDAVIPSHKLLVRAGFIQPLAAGLWSFLPLGYRVFKKIKEIICEEIDAIGGQEVNLPALIPKTLWEETNRWKTIEPPLFKLKDRHQKELGLGSTHEEVITDLARRYNLSYKDLPFYLYQIQNKFRNEMRATGGLLRTREFVMKDMYSFHSDQKDLEQYYQQGTKAYKNIFTRCGLNTVMVEASSGSIGGNTSNEFMVLADSGEDKIICCPKCGYAANTELGKKQKCPKCQSILENKNSIEVGHIFKLDTIYSKKMNLRYIDKTGKKQEVWMGCYGIGVGRLIAAIVESCHDKSGIIWPKSIAPFVAHLLILSKNVKIAKQAEKIYNNLIKQGIEVLYDDRDVSPGIKLTEADLIGLPVRLVVSDKTGDKIEIKYKNNDKVELISSDKLVKLIKKCK